MRLLKLTAFLSLWAVFFVLVAAVHLWVSILGLPNRWKIISRLNRNYTLLLRLILNIKVSVVGDEGQLERGGYVIIANHVSYVDGIVLGGIFPILFVSKREVKNWPVVGQWNVLCGSIFINRQRKDQVAYHRPLAQCSQSAAGGKGGWLPSCPLAHPNSQKNAKSFKTARSSLPDPSWAKIWFGATVKKSSAARTGRNAQTLVCLGCR